MGNQVESDLERKNFRFRAFHVEQSPGLIGQFFHAILAGDRRGQGDEGVDGGKPVTQGGQGFQHT
jgi:hypothetical protein